MGASGAGKSTVGAALATALGWSFVEGDALHPPANVEKMRAGTPLTDDDRAPWLDAIADVIRRAQARREPLVVACSALRRRYRDRLRDEGGGALRFVHLQADAATLRRRVAGRREHFAGPALVNSQMEALEDPGAEALAVDAGAPVELIVAQVRDWLASE